MRVILAGGGTGGHLYPALAIARALVKLDPSVEPFFIGAHRGIERDVLPTTGFPYALLDLHPLYRRTPWNNWKTIVGAVRAWRRVARLVRESPPAVVVGTGGYASGVMMAYAVRHRIPLVQQVGDSFPGLTARRFSRWSREVYLTFPEAARFLSASAPGALVDTGAPIEPPSVPRPERSAARAEWGFPATGGRVLLVTGASQGSLAINRAVADWIDRGLPDDLYVIWITGKATHGQFARYNGGRVQVRAYLSPIAPAYAAADLAVARASAMTVSELAAWGVPPVLVPLPTAAADHQTTNALTLERAGAAIHLPQSQLTGATLEQAVRGLLDNPARFAALVEGAARRARPDAAATIARRILALARTSASRS